MKIHYSQCWEDPRPLLDALEITPGDDALSIASGGDNTFALLLGNPRTVTAIDRNPVQLFLVELKIRAIQQLDYDDFVGFVGASSCRNRERMYKCIRPFLSRKAQVYWDKRPKALRKGIIHCGKFERYFRAFNRLVLPLIHSRTDIKNLLAASSLDEQKEYYDRVWNSKRWRCMFRVFFGRFLLSHLGRSSRFFRYVTADDIAGILFRRAQRGLTQVPIRENFFVEYIVTGQYSNLEISHPYLSRTGFHIIKERIGGIRLVCADLGEYIKTLPPGEFSKLNLSDVFEYMAGQEVEETLHEILRVSRHDARMAFWTLFVPHSIPQGLDGQIVADSCAEEKLQAINRTFFYENFCVWQLR